MYTKGLFLSNIVHKSVRVLSHLPHLVRLIRTRVCWCSSFEQVRMQQSHLSVHQKQTKQAYRDLLEEVVSVRFQTNPGVVVCGENVIRPQTDPTAKRTLHFWTKPVFLFKDTSSQQVKRMLSRDCILLCFSWFGPEQTVWCEKEPKRLKIATLYIFCFWSGTKQVNYQTFLVWIHPKSVLVSTSPLPRSEVERVQKYSTQVNVPLHYWNFT